ncbi:response regulator [Maribacter cobaltidurans]|uniref:Uncharacterized protein n=1 Tax=Maribacter cobaltidurans TaxID=1178778 RepID=A0A223V1A1_9FLAO|nr:response regulator [Maribacter cobaltidurans]ASV28977.1 hypothetical protein CJ263_01335 [Maribacter cobaltidurans]GGD72978.1 response regulator [Maribacter cobaltidurans]
MNILLVEDNLADLFIIQEAIDELNVAYRLETATNGEMALKKIREISQRNNVGLFDLILLDLNIPNPDGRLILKFLKSDLRFSNIPVVILTTSSDLKDIKYAYQNHANAFVTKPYDIENFSEYIKNISLYFRKLT